jgi:tRNA-uridine 2-sulfurtransferase
MKALCIFSGGLDSMLASQLVRVQGLEVLAFFFETPFFRSDRARKSAAHMDLPLKVVDISDRHLEVVQSPKHGYGANMNPCIDCHILMLRIAGELLEQEGADFVISGEVLGQRPMSQNRAALNRIAAESGLGDLLLRPLSAKHLPITLPEESGWVNRDLLMDIMGRSRKPQMALAEKFHIHDYPSPAGGCLLTEKAFSHRLGHLFSIRTRPRINEIELLKLGRHFRLDTVSKLVVGRNRQENQDILALAEAGEVVMMPVTVPGPTALLTGPTSPPFLGLAAHITAAYSDTEGKDSVEIRAIHRGREEQLTVVPKPKENFRSLMI